MGDLPCLGRAEARVPGLSRRILGGIAPLRFGEGRDCSMLATLAVATKSEYDWLMGTSGAAFVTRIDAVGWDPAAAAPLDRETRERAARAAGVKVDEVAPPFDEELRELVGARIAESIDAGTPALVRGLHGPAEYGLLIGYDDGTFLARTYFDKGPEPSRVGWDAFVDAERGAPIFLDPRSPLEKDVAIAQGLEAAMAGAATTDEAMASWAAALRDDARWTDRQHAGSAAFADHAMRTLLADTRRAAARFLRGIRPAVPPRAGGDALRAAEEYGAVADAAEKAGAGAFDGSVALRFLDPGTRRGWANLLDGAAGHEREARAALASARAALR